MQLHLRLKQVFHESGGFGGGLRLCGGALRAAARILAATAAQASVAAAGRDLMSGSSRRLLSPNRELHNCFAGRRCFVLGAGSSLNRQDLTPLREELVITVNEMFRHLPTLGIDPAFVVILDEAHFDESPGYRRFLQDLDTQCTKSGTRAVLNIAGEPVVKARGLFQSIPPSYVLSVGSLLALRHDRRPASIDASLPLPGTVSVTQMATALALHMGCREIYLLGVDLDFIARPEEPVAHCYGSSLYNDYDTFSAREIFEREKGYDYVQLLGVAAQEIQVFRALAEIGRARGQRIYNATDAGYLHGLPRQVFQSLFVNP